ncbi:hypothetical protein AB3480_35460 [Rhizobium mongolense]|uniref:hypothetical protein n=1 Tax=Rhizobium mongolense TaxID=57676 RepID=UPI0034A13F6E
MELLIVGFGPVAGYKYSRCINSAIYQGQLSRYHVIDRESQRQQVEARLAKLPIQPASCTYIPENVLQDGAEAGIRWLMQHGLFAKSDNKKKVVVTTEPQSHGAYITHALAQQFDVLVSKPLILPMKDGILDHQSFMPNVHAIAQASVDARVNTAMLCLGRLHDIYERRLRQPIELMVERLRTPITSVHVKTASGVWNLPFEFGLREDHPYKYGYGMLMHGAYHYIDNLARLLLVNRKLFPTEDFVLTLRGFTATPHDQHLRIGNLDSQTTGYRDEFSELPEGIPYGETDIVASYALKFRSSGRVLCLGTISLEQTTPGMRSWGPFPEVPYNVNGRLHCTDIDVRLGTVFSIAANVTKHPIGARLGDTDIRGVNTATVVTRANARLARTQGFIRREHYERPYGNSYSYTAEAEIFERWLLDRPTHSDFQSHVPSCAILDALLKLAAADWQGDVEIDFNYAGPEWPTLSQYDDPWYAYMADNVAFSSEH